MVGIDPAALQFLVDDPNGPAAHRLSSPVASLISAPLSLKLHQQNIHFQEWLFCSTKVEIKVGDEVRDGPKEMAFVEHILLISAFLLRLAKDRRPGWKPHMEIADDWDERRRIQGWPIGLQFPAASWEAGKELLDSSEKKVIIKTT